MSGIFDLLLTIYVILMAPFVESGHVQSHFSLAVVDQLFKTIDYDVTLITDVATSSTLNLRYSVRKKI